MYLGMDGTGVPMRSEEIADRAGKQADGSAKTREAKLVTIWTAESRDEEGKPVRDPGWIHDPRSLPRILDQASELNLHSERVIIVPKPPSLRSKLDTVIPKRFWLGYSVPTRYGGTCIPPSFFKRPVHLLGGRPYIQLRLAEIMPVVSLDCNRFTLDAAFGDYFDGDKFRPHPAGSPP
jgi:hypothetical protein